MQMEKDMQLFFECVFQLLAQSLQNAKHRTVCTCSAIDVRAVISAIVNKIQKQYVLRMSLKSNDFFSTVVILHKALISGHLKCNNETVSVVTKCDPLEKHSQNAMDQGKIQVTLGKQDDNR